MGAQSAGFVSASHSVSAVEKPHKQRTDREAKGSSEVGPE